MWTHLLNLCNTFLMDTSCACSASPSREYISCMLCITSLVSASLVDQSFTLSVMVKSLSVMVKSFTLAVMIKSLTLAVMPGFICLTAGSTPDTCFGDVLHLVRLPGNLRTRALVMTFTLLDFLCFVSTIPSHARAVMMVLSLSGFSGIFSIFGATRR